MLALYVIFADFVCSLLAIDGQEASKRQNEDARNDLEGYLYRVRDLLSDERPGTPFVKCSKDSERKAISEKVDETLAWLNDEGEHADTSALTDKHMALAYVHPHLALP